MTLFTINPLNVILLLSISAFCTYTLLLGYQVSNRLYRQRLDVLNVFARALYFAGAYLAHLLMYLLILLSAPFRLAFKSALEDLRKK